MRDRRAHFEQDGGAEPHLVVTRSHIERPDPDLDAALRLIPMPDNPLAARNHQLSAISTVHPPLSKTSNLSHCADVKHC